MKLAVCMYGMIGGSSGSFGRGEELDPKISFENYAKYLFHGKEVDFFLHSWSVNRKQDLIRVYKPTQYKFEKAKDFSNISTFDYSLGHIKSYGDLFLEYGKEKAVDIIKKEISATHSRWLSTKASVGLLKDHIKKTGIRYDGVFLMRYDLIFLSKQNLPSLKKNQIFCCMRKKDFNEAVDDLFFYGSTESLMRFGKLYDRIKQYSVRAPFAAKQHIDYLNLKAINKWEKNIDYMLARDHLNTKTGRKSRIKKSIKKIFSKIIKVK